MGEQLIDRYADSSRHYHGLEHLGEVLGHVDLLADEAGDARAVRLAAWFHDAVYDVHATDNEEQSARLAEATLDESPALVAEVARLVRLTADHAASPTDRNGAVLCDADLAILASHEARYQRYTEAVREEYAYVPEEDFKAGRAAVLRQLLALPHLFTTSYGSAHWEQRARDNVTAELEALTR
jgi:predicted metal-dependent HD superfamily phosphohydrolase